MATSVAPLLSMPAPTPYIASSPSPQQQPHWPSPASPSPSAFAQMAPLTPQKQTLVSCRSVQNVKSLSRVKFMSIDALSWAERKTREASEKHLERQLARHEAGEAPVHRFYNDPREPRYLSDRRVRFAEAGRDDYVSGGLQQKI